MGNYTLKTLENKKITITEIARLTDTSPTAVSFALSGRTGISSETKDKILKFVETAGYIPSLSARTVRKKNLKIAVIISATQDFEVEKNMAGISDAIRLFNTTSIACDVYGYQDIGDSLTDVYSSVACGEYNGILISVPDNTFDRKQLEITNEINKKNIPIVSLSNKPSYFNISLCAWVDAKKGGAISADYLYSVGCVRALLLSGTRLNSIHKRYIDGFETHGRDIGLYSDAIFYTKDSEKETYDLTHEYFSNIYDSSLKTGVFITTCFSWPVCSALKDLGIANIPVIGMDLLPRTEEILKSGELLGTVCQGQTDLARSAMQRLIELAISGNSERCEDIISEPHIITRGWLSKSEY